MKAYRIKNWDSIFENAGSRKVHNLSWVAIPNKHDSAGYRRVMSLPDGLTIYGAWQLIVGVASKMPTRGLLANENGPLDADDLAVRTGAPATAFTRAFEVLIDPKIGWIEIVSADAAGCAGSTLPERPDEVALQDRTGPVGPDPTRENMTDKTDPVAGVLNSHFSGSGRNGSDARWRNVFCLDVVEALGLQGDRALAERRPLLAVARRFDNRADRDRCKDRCVQVAKEKAVAGLDRPAAAWQAAIDKEFPADGAGLRLAATG